LMATCAYRSFRSAAWSSRCSLDMVRSVSRRVVGLCWRPGRGGFSRAMLLRRWWIYRSSLTLSIGGGGSWSKTAQGYPLVHVPPSTCALIRAAGLVIDSQSLVGDGVFLDLVMVEDRISYWRASPRRWSWVAAAGFGGCRKS
jgi:hypothetical protein